MRLNLLLGLKTKSLFWTNLVLRTKFRLFRSFRCNFHVIITLIVDSDFITLDNCLWKPIGNLDVKTYHDFPVDCQTFQLIVVSILAQFLYKKRGQHCASLYAHFASYWISAQLHPCLCQLAELLFVHLPQPSWAIAAAHFEPRTLWDVFPMHFISDFHSFHTHLLNYFRFGSKRCPYLSYFTYLHASIFNELHSSRLQLIMYSNSFQRVPSSIYFSFYIVFTFYFAMTSKMSCPWELRGLRSRTQDGRKFCFTYNLGKDCSDECGFVHSCMKCGYEKCWAQGCFLGSGHGSYRPRFQPYPTSVVESSSSSNAHPSSKDEQISVWWGVATIPRSSCFLVQFQPRSELLLRSFALAGAAADTRRESPFENISDWLWLLAIG